MIPAAVAAALRDRALADTSARMRLRGAGKDLLDLLHRLSTGDVKGLAPGQGAATVLTSPKGRIVERLWLHHLGPRGVLVTGGEGSAERVLAHLRKYTFAEDTGLSDATADTVQFSLVGPAARACGLPSPEGLGCAEATVGGERVDVLGGDGLSGEGLTVLCGPEAAPEVLEDLRQRAGGHVLDAAGLELWRVLRGLPAPGRELTEDRNPLEAGLWDAVSFTKGCYVGQEVVARLRTYDKVARALVGLRLPAGPPLPGRGTAVLSGDRPAGEVTSAVEAPGGGTLALAFLKKSWVAPGTRVAVAGTETAVEELPFVEARA